MRFRLPESLKGQYRELISDEEELFIRWCVFRQHDDEDLNFRYVAQLPLRPLRPEDEDEDSSSEEDSSSRVPPPAVFADPEHRRAAQQLFNLYKKRVTRGTLIAPPDDYCPFELVERNTHSLRVLRMSVTNPFPPRSPSRTSTQNRSTSLSPTRQRTPIRRDAPQSSTSTPWNDHRSSTSMSEEDDTIVDWQTLMMNGTNLQGATMVQQNDVHVPDGRLVKKLVLLIPLQDSSLFRSSQDLKFKLNGEGTGIIATLPVKAPVDVVAINHLATKASEGSGAEALQLRNILLAGLRNSPQEGLEHKDYAYTLPGVDEAKMIQVSFAPKTFYFPGGITCNRRYFNDNAPEGELSYTIIPFQNLLNADLMANRFNVILTGLLLQAEATKKAGHATTTDFEAARVQANVAFKQLWKQDVMRKLPNGTAFVKLELMVDENEKSRSTNAPTPSRGGDADEAALLEGMMSDLGI